MSNSLSEIAKKVQERADSLLTEEIRQPLDPIFVKECLDANERGDGLLFASLFKDKFLYNTTPKDGEWFTWLGNVWEADDYSRAEDAVEQVALEYWQLAEDLRIEIKEQKITPKSGDSWKIALRDKYLKRVDRLRGRGGVEKVLWWAKIVDRTMACKEEQFNQNNWLLPVKNGVIDLESGALTSGRPSDLMTKSISVEYDQHADYTLWVEFLQEISDSEREIPEFLKRSIGYAATGFSFEQYIWLFLGPGRNGKGVFFNIISEILGPYFHNINAAMLLEQRNPPSPSAASEHLYSLLGKRLIVGSETNKNKMIDASMVKELTGEDEINCRPNFKSEINFYPTHTLMLRTNNVPLGMTQDFAMKERLLLLDFPYRYVDDVDLYKKKNPMFADRFRLKDKHLKDKLRKIKPGILRWIVEGCQEWQEIGLAPPKKVVDAVDQLGREEDYIGRFAEVCLERVEDQKTKISCKTMYSAFQWWWSENEGVNQKRMPAMKTVNKGLRERGFEIDQQGGITWVFGCHINLDVALAVDEFAGKR